MNIYESFLNQVSFLRKLKIDLSLKSSHCKASFTRDILTHNIAIKRYCDKKIFLSHWLIMAKVSSQRTTNQGTLSFVKSLPWPLEVNGSKISFYRNFFIAILYVKMSRVNKALTRDFKLNPPKDHIKKIVPRFTC